MSQWMRDSFEGTYQKPLLFYVVYGLDHFELRIEQARHRVDQVPTELDIRFFSRMEEDQKQYIDSFSSGYIGELLSENYPKLYKQASDAKLAAVIRGEFEDCNDLNYLKNTIGIIQAISEMGDTCILEVQTYQMYSAKDWSQRFFEPAQAKPLNHIQIIQTIEGETLRLSTRGMRSFGRPDLLLSDWPVKQKDAGIDLINLFIDYFASGGLPNPDQEIQIKGLPSGMRIQECGSWDDPIFNNKHVEICWPG